MIHLAAVSHDNRSNTHPEIAYRNSHKTLFNTLECIKENKKIHLIWLSSSMVYGNFKKKTVTEMDQCSPIGIYGALKLSGELLIKAYSNVYSTNYSIIRPSALYGERCISNRVIQIFLENAFEKKKINIRGDGKEKLDFTYIGDLCEGIYRIIKFKSKSKNQIYNLTFGSAKSILDLKKLILSKFKKQKFKNVKRSKLIALRGTLSINKAKKDFSYKPDYNLDKGFEKYYKWYQSIYKKLKIFN